MACLFALSVGIIGRPLLLCAQQDQLMSSTSNQPIVGKIFIHGNRQVSTQAILNRLPYKEGRAFDPEQSGRAIRLLYAMGYFHQIQLEREDIDNKTMHLHVLLKEKSLLKKITISGNRVIKTDKLLEKLNAKKIITVDEETVARLTNEIKKAYREESYHNPAIEGRIIPDEKSKQKVRVHFTINDGPRSMITRVGFRGNKKIPSRKLSKVIFTREQWLLSFLDDAGKFDKEKLDMDKHRIEYFYRDNGYLMARVTDARISFSKNKKVINVVFEIKEGKQFRLTDVRAIGYKEFSESELLPFIYLKKGDIYSQSKLVKSIERLKREWGQKGYIYADVYPQITPNTDDNSVSVTFHAEPGSQMRVNRINITGNKLTRDKVIRREILFEEGDLLTSQKLAASKTNVEFLSYFGRGGVNWKIHRLTDTLADVELHVEEGKTFQLNATASYGSDKYASKRSVKGVLNISKKNMFGLGIDASAMVQGSRKRFQRAQLHIFDPYFLDTNISAGLDFYIRHEEYAQWNNVRPVPEEETVGGVVRTGFAVPSIDNRLHFFSEFGVERIHNNKPQAVGSDADIFGPLLRRRLQGGTLVWLQGDVSYDVRNHKVYPNTGYRLTLGSKLALPFLNHEFSMLKTEVEASWYTALIGEDSLVLALHGRGGFVRKLSDDKVVPYKELFHMGGQNTVRGFIWGSIEPAFLGNPMGAQNAILFNAELVFPLLNDYSMKGHIFYDAGAGWTTPKDDNPDRNLLKRDKFDLRHSIGVGLNLVYPQAIKIDWGYKLDRKKDDGESPYEWHISMNMAW